MSGDGPNEPDFVFPFGPGEPLQRVADVQIRLRTDGSILVGDRAHYVGPLGLRVLETFASPITLREAMAALQPHLRGAQEWVSYADTIRLLFSLGVIESSADARGSESDRLGFDDPLEHINMLNDRARTDAYLRAIPQVVRPGDVVVEIGSGSGVLAMAAARAGAEHVYSIEAGSIGKAAKAVFEANGLADRITLIPGHSTQVAIPRPADVLLSEIIGNEPLEERVLESTRDAIQRFLIPQARFIPQRIRIYGVPVRIPQALVAARLFTESATARWKDWYGMDFARLKTGNAASALRIFLRPHILRDWIRVSQPALLTEIDLTSAAPARIESEARVRAERSETINGIFTFFDLQLSPDVELTTDPGQVNADCSWRLPVWIVSNPFRVEPGEALRIRYAYPAPTDRRVVLSK